MKGTAEVVPTPAVDERLPVSLFIHLTFSLSSLKKFIFKLGPVAHACSPCYSGGGGGESYMVQQQLRQKQETLSENKLKQKGLWATFK
jgi:hypothetical protein